MKKSVLALAFMLTGSFAFANVNHTNSDYNYSKNETSEMRTSSETELNLKLESLNLIVSNVDYDQNRMICGFTLSYDNGYGNSWSTEYDCSGMTMSDIWNFIMAVFF